MKSILFIVAHSDDHVLGAGGTIAKYVKEGRKVHVIILSYGELSHVWLKSHFRKHMRAQEAYRAGKVLGCSTTFFDFKELKFMKGYTSYRRELLDQIKSANPGMIYTHAVEDKMHPDHVATANVVNDICTESEYSTLPVYSFMIWTPRHFSKGIMKYVDITYEFMAKMQALFCFKSQRWNAIYPLLPGVMIKSIKDGLTIGSPFAERFKKVR